jgi:hypothetical protein
MCPGQRLRGALPSRCRAFSRSRCQFGGRCHTSCFCIQLDRENSMVGAAVAVAGAHRRGPGASSLRSSRSAAASGTPRRAPRLGSAPHRRLTNRGTEHAGRGTEHASEPGVVVDGRSCAARLRPSPGRAAARDADGDGLRGVGVVDLRVRCPGRKPPFLAVKRPACPYKSPIQNQFT